jgi:hypothetical protein
MAGFCDKGFKHRCWNLGQCAAYLANAMLYASRPHDNISMEPYAQDQRCTARSGGACRHNRKASTVLECGTEHASMESSME